MDLYSLVTNFITTLLSYILPQRYHRNVHIFLKTLPRDLRLIVLTVKILCKSTLLKYANATAIPRLEAIVRKYPNKTCFLFEDQKWTFKQVDEYSNRIAHVFQRSGLKKGDVVGLNMTNCPEYVCIWLGLAKIGVVIAFINTNLRNEPLTHSIKIAKCKAVIYSSDLAEAVNDIRTSLDSSVKYYQLGETGLTENTVNLNDALKTVSSVPVRRDYNANDHLVYIFTSGTTGLPKAAIVPHSRYMLMSIFVTDVLGVTPDDILYNPLPLYHMAGGLLGVSAALQVGAAVVIKKKFSASNYIEDCIKYNCSIGQYIGEMCRYILATKEKPTDKQHKLRVVVGNGLRESIWKAFVDRFKIPKVMEVYGSTEGNLQFVNTDNTVGAVGFIPRFFPKKLVSYFGVIIKVNQETMEPIRGPDGLCISCDINEPGMFIGIIPPKNSLKDFHGYLDKKETGKKYIYDVLKKGDKAFMSGDIVMMDEFGYLYFKDRTGDTFRWKGENVATSEVEAVISKLVDLKDCIVYGVQVGDLEGKAGMAAIADTSGQLDLSALAASLDKALPKYAQPVFIRVLPEIELTGTFKPKKMTLAKEGFDPSIVKDPLFFRKGANYIPLTNELYEQIVSGQIHI